MHKGYFTGIPIYILVVSCSILLRMRNFLDKVAEKIKIHDLCCNSFFFNFPIIVTVMR